MPGWQGGTRPAAPEPGLVAPRDYGRSAPNPRGICLWWLSRRKRRRQRGRILRSGSASPPSSLEVPPWGTGPWLSPGGHSSHLSPSPLLVPGVSTPGAVGPCVGAGSLFQSLAEAGATQAWGQEQRRAATWGHPKSQGHPERADAAAPGLGHQGLHPWGPCRSLGELPRCCAGRCSWRKGADGSGGVPGDVLQQGAGGPVGLVRWERGAAGFGSSSEAAAPSLRLAAFPSCSLEVKLSLKPGCPWVL